MKTIDPVPDPLPILYRQSWIFVFDLGAPAEAGCSYHLTIEDAAAFVTDYLATHSPTNEEGHEEPLGEPQAVHTTLGFYERVKSTAYGLRSR